MKKLTDGRQTPSDGNTSHDPLGVMWAKKEYIKNYDAILLSKYDSAEKRY